MHLKLISSGHTLINGVVYRIVAYYNMKDKRFLRKVKNFLSIH